jgi:hypothetical protein
LLFLNFLGELTFNFCFYCKFIKTNGNTLPEMLKSKHINKKSTKIWSPLSRKKFIHHHIEKHPKNNYFQFTLSNLFISLPFSFITTLILIDRLDTPRKLHTKFNHKLPFLVARISGLILFVMGSLHSTLNSITMICLTRPYRQALIEMFYFLTCRRRARNLSIVAFENSLETSERIRRQSVMIARSRRASKKVYWFCIYLVE